MEKVESDKQKSTIEMPSVEPIRPSTSSLLQDELTKRKPTIREKFRTLWKQISVEPLLLCWIAPSVIAYIAVDNLQLQKACRVNFNSTDEVCRNMIDKTMRQIVCNETAINTEQANADPLSRFARSAQYGHGYGNGYGSGYGHGYGNGDEYGDGDGYDDDGHRERNDNFYTTTDGYYVNSLSGSPVPMDTEVCVSEIRCQRLDTEIAGYIAPIESLLIVLVILFAISRNQRGNLRKYYMLLPMFGELAGFFVNLIAAIFFDQLPMEFNAILSKICPATGGKEYMMLIAIYTYLSQRVPEKDRAMRFSLIAIYIQILRAIFAALSGTLFKWFEYIPIFIACIVINVIGIVYVIFGLKEVKNVDEILEMARRNAGSPNEKATNQKPSGIDELKKKGNCIKDIYNAVVNFYELMKRKRAYHARRYLLFIFILYFICIAPNFGEEKLEYNYVRNRLNWDGEKHSPLLSFGNFTCVIGNWFLLHAVSKFFGLADTLIGLISVMCSAMSRIAFANARNALLMYVGKSFDMFAVTRATSLKSIVSIVVEKDEIAKAFSIIAMLECVAKSLSVPLYTRIYAITINSWPGAFYVCSFLCLALASIMFLALHCAIKRLERQKTDCKMETVQIS